MDGVQGLPARWTRVRVSGPSMSPTLKHGDQLLVAGTGRARPGDVVLARFPARPELLNSERYSPSSSLGDRWWVEGDNPLATDDSRAFGPAVVVGRVLLRVWPRPGRLPRSRP